MYKSIFIIAVLFGVASANVAEFKKCDGVSDDVCEVSEVDVTPCNRPKNHECTVKKGKESSISFQFTPKFSSANMTTGLYWARDTGDIPFGDLNRVDGCQFTTCPLESGKKQELIYKLLLNKKLPSGHYTIKWKLWNSNNESELCCFMTNIALRM